MARLGYYKLMKWGGEILYEGEKAPDFTDPVMRSLELDSNYPFIEITYNEDQHRLDVKKGEISPQKMLECMQRGVPARHDGFDSIMYLPVDDTLERFLEDVIANVHNHNSNGNNGNGHKGNGSNGNGNHPA